MQIHEIKFRLSILTVLNQYSLKPDRNHMVRCPFHEDDSPSMKIYTNTNSFHCFGCSKAGDQIEFIQLKQNCSKHEAIQIAKSLVDPLQTINTKPVQIPEDKPFDIAQDKDLLPRLAVLSKVAMESMASFKRTAKARKYAQDRKLNTEKLEPGYIGTEFGKKWNKLLKESALNLGILKRSRQKTIVPKFKNCILFFTKNNKGQVAGIYGRSILTSKSSVRASAKHFYLAGTHRGLYPCYPPKETKRLILTEAIIDCATLYGIPEITDNYALLSLFGTNGFTPEIEAAIKALPDLKEVIIFFDGDKAGYDAAIKTAERLKVIKPGLTITKADTPEGEDVNSLLEGHEPEILTQLINDRRDIFLLTEKNELPEKKTAVSVAELPTVSKVELNTKNPEFITFTTAKLQIIILGGINLQQLDRMRVTVKISRRDTDNPLHSIRHTIDLYHSNYLEKFIEKAGEQLETGTTVIRKALATLTDQIEEYRIKKIESRKKKHPHKRLLTDSQRRKAISYLSHKNLMERTGTDIGKTGLVGEELNRLLMYLVFTSRLRDQPLHIISLGASGTGKTYLQEKVSQLIPEPGKLEITILSENAFYYFERQELKHKLVLIEDMDGAENVLYPLRELQSKKRISKSLPLKDNRGNLKTVSLNVEGPICLAGTTTREKLYEDNASRSLLIYLDNSKEHKQKIMDYQRKLSAGKIDTVREQQLIELFKDMQTVLKPVKVKNPFAEYLVIPEHVFKPLRTNSHYLSFIETITFYHQYQREVKTDPITNELFIETTLEDIEWANRLLKDVLLTKADELPKAVRDFFERLKRWLTTNGKESFFAKLVREEFRITSSSCNRYILELLRNNYIKITGGNKYRRGYEYQVVKPDEYGWLQRNIQNALDQALENIKRNLVSQYPTVSQNENGILKKISANNLQPVSQYPTKMRGTP